MNKILRAGLLLSVIALAGCDRAETGSAAVDTAAIEQQIKGIEAQWNKEYNARDIDALAGQYSADAAMANPGMALASDSASRREGIIQFVADPNLKIEFASDRVLVAKSGELASSRGHYSMQTTDPATKKPRTDSGSYLTVWQKQADGSWKAVEDFVVPGAPAEAG
ncbi:MAG: nuclear transport factor 2 family protein [Sphingomicrobium sp.]